MKKNIVFFLLISIFLFVSFDSQAICVVGEKTKVEWKGSWYPATVLKVNGDQCFIHYDGYGDSWDEWVGPSRIKATSLGGATQGALRSWKEGDPLSVKWKGTWYPAHVLKVNGDQLFIHYDGYDNSWDEWVGPARYR